MKKVFISYSHDDIEAQRDLQQYLINLERNGDIEIWQDGMINTGDDWNESITTALDEADIVIMLVSQSFISSTYVHGVEVPMTLKNLGEGKTKIFPILIKQCDWAAWRVLPDNIDRDKVNKDKGKMGQYQFFPMDEESQRLKPLNRWDFPEDAWTQVAEKIRNMV